LGCIFLRKGSTIIIDINDSSKIDTPHRILPRNNSTKDAFRKWLSERSTFDYTIQEIIDCLDRVSDYILKTGISHVELWEITQSNTFEILLENKRLEIAMQRLLFKKGRFKNIIVASQLYLEFLRANESTSCKSTSIELSKTKAPSLTLIYV